jgi:hypothetical protein
MVRTVNLTHVLASIRSSLASNDVREEMLPYTPRGLIGCVSRARKFTYLNE